MEAVVLGFDAGVLDHAAGVGLEPGHGAADVLVDLDDFFDRGGFEERGGDTLFNAEEDAVAGCYLGGVRAGCGVYGAGEGTPMAVEPSLMASREYSTWKRRPSGEKVLGDAVRDGAVVGGGGYLMPRSGGISYARGRWGWGSTIFGSCDEHGEFVKLREVEEMGFGSAEGWRTRR